MPISVKLPLIKNRSYGMEPIVDFKELSQQHLKNLLLTIPGERIGDLNFGVGLRRYLFEANTSFSAGDLRSRIKKQIGTYLPYIEVVDIFVTTPTAETLFVEMRYHIKVLNETFTFEVRV